MIDTYLDDAKRVAAISSDRSLAKSIGISQTSLRQYRLGMSLPTDAVMLQIAELAGIPADQALLDLAVMRSNSDPAKAVLLNLKKRLTTACIAGVLALSLTSQARADSPPSPLTTCCKELVYIMENGKRALEGLFYLAQYLRGFFILFARRLIACG